MRDIDVDYNCGEIKVHIDGELVAREEWSTLDIRRWTDSSVTYVKDSDECVNDFIERFLSNVDDIEDDEWSTMKELLEEKCGKDIRGHFQCSLVSKYQKEYEEALEEERVNFIHTLKSEGIQLL